jgi:hypothetical protein
MIGDAKSVLVQRILSSTEAFGCVTVSKVDPSMDSDAPEVPSRSKIRNLSVLAPRDDSPLGQGQVVSVNSSPRLPALTTSNNEIVADDDNTTNRKRLNKRRSSDEMDSQVGDETDSHSDRERKTSAPQHETEKENDESSYRYETELHNAMLIHRNKRVLLSRLIEVAPRGKLTVVRIHCTGNGIPSVTLPH